MSRAEQEATRHERAGFMRARLESLWDEKRGRVWGDRVVILGTRYGGSYEGANWIAWIGELDWLDDYQGDDIDCMTFWDDYADAPMGRGRTPEDALADLSAQAKAAWR